MTLICPIYVGEMNNNIQAVAGGVAGSIIPLAIVITTVVVILICRKKRVCYVIIRFEWQKQLALLSVCIPKLIIIMQPSLG